MKHLIILAAVSGLLVTSGSGVAKANVIYTTTYSGANERPTPNDSPGTAFGTFTYETAKNDIVYSVTFSGLLGNAQAAHIHLGGVNATGPVILPFPSPSGKNGTFSGVLTNADLINKSITGITDLAQVNLQGLAGNLYANLHSTIYTGGEIRGQLASAIPEPGTLSVLSIALGLLVARGRREALRGKAAI